MNLLKGKTNLNGSAMFEGPGGTKLPIGGTTKATNGQSVVFGVRPEHFSLADDGAAAEVLVVEPTGSEVQIVAKMGGEDVIAVFRERHAFKPGDKIKLKPDPKVVHLFDEATGARLNT
jgi:multiple sugar transport system ATP-binding protein